MTRPRHLLLFLLLPAALGLLLAASPGHAQDEAELALAGADSTLMRDTLGLSFPRLFTLADSLGVLPDSLRALSVRYRWSLPRLVRLADSLEVPMTGLAAAIRKERLDRPAGRERNETRMTYSTTDNIQRRATSWNNSLDVSVLRGPWKIDNTSNVQLDRTLPSSRRETRSSTTEASWSPTKDLSFGGRANLYRYNGYDPGSASNDGETKNEFQLSMKTRHQPTSSTTSSLNLYGGFLDVTRYDLIKRGASADVNGSLKLTTSLITHELRGQVTGNLARTRQPQDTLGQAKNTSDLSGNLRGTLGLFPSWPAGLNVNYSLRQSRVVNIQQTRLVEVFTRNGSLDATLRLRLDNDRYMNVTGRLTTQKSEQGTLTNSRSRRDERSFAVDGRYRLAGWNLESRFSLGDTRGEYPDRTTDGGNSESLTPAAVSATVKRKLGPKLTFTATGNVRLDVNRYDEIGTYKSTPTNMDLYKQDYKIDVLYSSSERFSSSVALNSTRTVTVNIPADAKGRNNEKRVYGVTWRWNLRLLPGLTATQTNTVGADYLHYYENSVNDNLTLSYNTNTTLNALLSPRLSVGLRHNAQHQPAGTYGPLDDGLTYLSRSSVNDTYSLSASMSYTPSPALSFFTQPAYESVARKGATGGLLQPKSTNRRLNFNGGVTLNLSVGGRGRFSGSLQRSYLTVRSVAYDSEGQVLPDEPQSPQDYWSGSLQFSWEL